MAITIHPESTKKLILDLFRSGMSSREVVREANKQLRGKLDNCLTKNSVIGIKHRAGMCVPRDPRSYPTSRKKNYSRYDKSLAFNEKLDKVSYEKQVKNRLLAALAKPQKKNYTDY
tara:strand:+ start:150 stop:497 length:348 start_codon:yes stop_codon:yes gene_type:complete